MKRQPPLLDRMAALLDIQRTRQYRGERHLEHCQRGFWVGNWGTQAGAPCPPCSPRCRAIADVLAEYQRQPEMFEATA